MIFLQRSFNPVFISNTSLGNVYSFEGTVFTVGFCEDVYMMFRNARLKELANWAIRK